MATLLAAIKTRFDDPTVGLTTSLFSELFQGEVPESEGKPPYATIVGVERTRIGGTFTTNTFSETFTIHVFGKTQEDAEQLSALVEAVFVDGERNITVADLDLLMLRRDGSRTYTQIEPDIWESAIGYEAQYSEDR